MPPPPPPPATRSPLTPRPFPNFFCFYFHMAEKFYIHPSALHICHPRMSLRERTKGRRRLNEAQSFSLVGSDHEAQRPSGLQTSRWGWEMFNFGIKGSNLRAALLWSCHCPQAALGHCSQEGAAHETDGAVLFGKWNALSREPGTWEQTPQGGKAVCGKLRMQKEICLWQRAPAAPKPPQGERSHPTYSVLQRCSNVVPSSAGDGWDIFTVGESDRG